MAKAFTEIEKNDIQQKLLEEGMKQFKEKGLKKVSVRDLTQAVGIAQGGFYTFYDSKESLFVACVNQRIFEKMESFMMIPTTEYPEKIREPIPFLADQVYKIGMHLKDNLCFNNFISDSVMILLGDYDNFEANGVVAVKEVLIKLISYWKEHGIVVDADTKGLRAFMKAVIILFMNENIIGTEYFPQLYRTFIDENIKHYFQVEGKFRP